MLCKRYLIKSERFTSLLFYYYIISKLLKLLKKNIFNKKYFLLEIFDIYLYENYIYINIYFNIFNKIVKIAIDF